MADDPVDAEDMADKAVRDWVLRVTVMHPRGNDEAQSMKDLSELRTSR